MIAWYQAVFDCKVQYQNPMLAFLTYDDEHQRVIKASPCRCTTPIRTAIRWSCRPTPSDPSNDANRYTLGRRTLALDSGPSNSRSRSVQLIFSVSGGRPMACYKHQDCGPGETEEAQGWQGAVRSYAPNARGYWALQPPAGLGTGSHRR
jgi:hypothetical protein